MKVVFFISYCLLHNNKCSILSVFCIIDPFLFNIVFHQNSHLIVLLLHFKKTQGKRLVIHANLSFSRGFFSYAIIICVRKVFVIVVLKKRAFTVQKKLKVKNGRKKVSIYVRFVVDLAIIVNFVTKKELV